MPLSTTHLRKTKRKLSVLFEASRAAHLRGFFFFGGLDIGRVSHSRRKDRDETHGQSG